MISKRLNFLGRFFYLFHAKCYQYTFNKEGLLKNVIQYDFKLSYQIVIYFNLKNFTDENNSHSGYIDFSGRFGAAKRKETYDTSRYIETEEV